MFKSKSKLNLLTIWLLHWLLLKQLLTIISAKWFSLYYSITIRFFKLWAYKMWRLYYFLTFSYYSPLAKSMLETYCVWELLSFVDHASTNICRKKTQKFLRNQENVGFCYHFRKKNLSVLWFNILMFSNRKEIKSCTFHTHELSKYNVVKLSTN